MTDAFKRRQLLLRREDGAPGGFIRLEQVGGRVTVEVTASGVPDGARTVLLQKDSGQPLPIGGLIRGAGKFTPKLPDIDDVGQVTVAMGDKPLLIGGDGATFAQIAGNLKPPAPVVAPAKRVAQAQPVDVSSAVGAATERGTHEAAQQAATGGDVHAAAEAAERAAAGAAGYAAVEVAQSVLPNAGDPADADALFDDPYPPAQERPAQDGPPSDGWMFTPASFPGGLDRVTGHLLENGETAAVLEAVRGPWAPEPPPGLPGFVFDGGYWVQVKETK